VIGQIVAVIATIALSTVNGCAPTSTTPKDESTIKPGTKKVNPIVVGPTGRIRITNKFHPKISMVSGGSKGCRWMVYYAIPHGEPGGYDKVVLAKGNPGTGIDGVDLGKKYKFSYTDLITRERVDKRARGTHFETTECSSWRRK